MVSPRGWRKVGLKIESLLSVPAFSAYWLQIQRLRFDLYWRIHLKRFVKKSVLFWSISSEGPLLKWFSWGRLVLSISCNLQFNHVYSFICAKCSEYLKGFCGLSPFCWFLWQFSWRTRWTLDYVPLSRMRKDPSHLSTSRPLIQNQRTMCYHTTGSSVTDD